MVYCCPHCRTWFKKNQIITAEGRFESVIECRVCGRTTEIQHDDVRMSHIYKGYGFLESGDFSSALTQFNMALKQCSTDNDRLDAYIGRALANYSVRTVYQDHENAESKKPPELTCYLYNHEEFKNDEDYKEAKRIIQGIGSDIQKTEEIRLAHLCTYIDGVKHAYDELDKAGKEYQLFIAFKDGFRNWEDGWEKAQGIIKELPNEMNRVFVPNRSDSQKDLISYEGEILYATYHSNSMLVLVDREVDNRLMDLYSRYEHIHRNHARRSSLGFVCYNRAVHIYSLNNQYRIEQNVYTYRNQTDLYKVIDFVCGRNRILVSRDGDTGSSSVNPTPSPTPQVSTTAAVSLAPVLAAGNRVVFGHYPQRAEKKQSVVNHFGRLEKPTEQDDKGWSPMLAGKGNGITYMWYRDAMIDGVKYRGIYFSQYRDIMAVRESDLKPTLQRSKGFQPKRIHIFRFDPIYWNIIERVEAPYRRYTLIPSMGLDSHPFNDVEECGLWDVSTLRTWLNSTFLNTAFTEEEQKYLNVREGERVFLIGEATDLQNSGIKNAIVNANLGGTDYFHCMGGKDDMNIAWLWIQGEECFEDTAKVLSLRNRGDISETTCDNTSVAVIPKIYVNVK